MAVNVVMVFFMNGNPHSIKKWGWLYCLVCYGGPLIVALVCLQLRAPGKGQVYGSAGVSQPAHRNQAHLYVASLTGRI